MKAFHQFIPGRYRARMSAYIFWDIGRCDALSSCSRHANSLIAIIHADIARAAAKTDNNNECTTRDETTSSNKDIIFGAVVAAAARQHHDYCCGLSESAYSKALALLNTEDGLLFLRRTNRLALATIAEALLQAQMRTTIISDQCVMQKTMVVLEALETAVEADYPPSVSVTVTEAIDARLALLKHLGKGIALLKETRDARYVRDY